jgi:hypothetical protein
MIGRISGRLWAFALEAFSINNTAISTNSGMTFLSGMESL